MTPSSVKPFLDTLEVAGAPCWIISQWPGSISIWPLLPGISMFRICGHTSPLHCGLLKAGIVCSPSCICGTCGTSHRAWHKAVRNKSLMSDRKGFVIVCLRNKNLTGLRSIYLVLSRLKESGATCTHTHRHTLLHYIYVYTYVYICKCILCICIYTVHTHVFIYWKRWSSWVNRVFQGKMHTIKFRRCSLSRERL